MLLGDVHVSVGGVRVPLLQVTPGSVVHVLFALLALILRSRFPSETQPGVPLCRDLEGLERAAQRWPFLCKEKKMEIRRKNLNFGEAYGGHNELFGWKKWQRGN